MNFHSDMNNASRPGPTSSHILLAGAALGLLANYLIWPGGLQGPGFAVWVVLLATSALWVTCNAGRTRIRVVALWGTTAVLAAGMLVFRNVPVLIPAMWLVMTSAAAMIFLHVRGISMVNARVPDLLTALLQVPAQAIAGAPLLLVSIDLPAVSSNPRWQGILRGTLMALPLLFIFSILFSSADAGFSRLLPDLGDFFSEATARHVALILFFTWVSAGLLKGISKEASPSALQPGRSFQLGAEETGVIMSLLTALFVVFVVLQISYLFGGRETIEATTGLTLADYARHGFFELIVVAGLTLVVLLVLGATSGRQRLFRILAAVLIACVLIMLASAVQRFNLYIDAYGLTIDRLVALTVMVWFAVSLALFAGTVLRGRVAGFASSMAISGIAIVLIFGCINPAAQVAKVNIQRALPGSQERTSWFESLAAAIPGFVLPQGANAQFDFNYLLSLGADVVPILLAHIDEFTPNEQAAIAVYLLDKYSTNRIDKDWRTWNASRAAAERAVREQSSSLQEIINDFNEDFETYLFQQPQP